MVGQGEALRLATELARVRQRGIALVDRVGYHQSPVVTPILDQLLVRGELGISRSRAAAIAELLDLRLLMYGEESAAQASFVRSLFFDRDGRGPGALGAAGLLNLARKGRGITPDAFHHLQRQELIDFARFLLRCDAELRSVADSDRFFGS
ncbi:hypothetical protein [Jatrophihabitans endophyticus]|uniref:hypothetical protein n=1 Tax=Jatrophihabitans endophyticus TaxID=1206085 RepID=UPI000933BE95|nr:hypothetical protein [Jatrophihabitans endophyticus]